jgi:signal recognition particle GTPase
MLTLADLRLRMLEMTYPARVRLLRITTPNALTVSDADFQSSGRRTVGMIDAMTHRERNAPETIDVSRAARIARGSGTTTREVIELVRSFDLLRDIL